MMPFGLQGAPATFQRMMAQLLAGCNDYAAAYLDDVALSSTVLAGRTTSITSAAFCKNSGRRGSQLSPRNANLEQSVGNGEVRPEESKLQAVKAFPTPATKKQVRAFLGLTGYYRKFIPGYAEVAAPLTDITRKNAPNKVQWSGSCDKAFSMLKGLLCSQPILKSPDFEQGFILQTDASERGIGAVLSQRNDAGAEHPVAFYSRKLIVTPGGAILNDWERVPRHQSSLSAREAVCYPDGPPCVGVVKSP